MRLDPTSSTLDTIHRLTIREVQRCLAATHRTAAAPIRRAQIPPAVLIRSVESVHHSVNGDVRDDRQFHGPSGDRVICESGANAHCVSLRQSGWHASQLSMMYAAEYSDPVANQCLHSIAHVFVIALAGDGVAIVSPPVTIATSAMAKDAERRRFILLCNCMA